MKTKLPLFLSISLLLLISACAGNTNTDVAVAVALTQTAAVPQTMDSQPTALPEATELAALPSTPQPVSDTYRVEFQPNTTSWYTNGDLAVGATMRYVVNAGKGQQLNISLSTDPASTDTDLYATLKITGADGQQLSFDTTTSWSGILPTSQDYFVDVTSLAQQAITYQIVVEIPAGTIDPALGAMYEPIPESLCLELKATAMQSLGVDFYEQANAPFLDVIGGEAGTGCRLGAGGTGAQFSSPQDVVAKLANSVGASWNEQPTYQADGPTGSSTALARDMGLMLISANWKPAMGVVCPSDQPISDCNLTPDQKTYIVQIDIAMYKADFSLDGHWEDTTTNFSLDLYQDWKNIYGHHTVVAQGGNKIDTLDVSINGMLKGKVATVQFQSSFTSDMGTAEITYIDVNTIQWKIIDPPDGEYYLPAEATLTRK